MTETTQPDPQVVVPAALLRRLSVKLGVIALIAAPLSLVLLGACDKPNTDPRKGPVEVSRDGSNSYYAKKQCDGTTLVYVFNMGGGSSVPDSPECAPTDAEESP